MNAVRLRLFGLIAGLSLLAGSLGGFVVTGAAHADTDRLRNAVSTVSVCSSTVTSTSTTGDFCGTEIATAVVTSTQTSSSSKLSGADQTAGMFRGARCFLTTTQNNAGETATFTIEAKDDVSGAYTTIATNAAGTGTSTYQLSLGPGVATTSNVSTGAVLSGTWRPTVTFSSTGQKTYSISCQRTP